MKVLKIKSETISAIVTYFNLGKYIDEALESIYNQTYKNIEVILINDGSTEQDSIDKLKELGEKYKDKLIIINQENKGPAAARNLGIKKAKGIYICYVDADDILDARYFEEAISYFHNHDVQIVTSWIKTFGEENQIIKYKNTELKDELLANTICGTSVYRKSMWKNIGGYDETSKLNYEDWDFWINALSKGNKVGVIKKVLFYYRIRKSSRLNFLNMDVDKKVQLQTKIYEKYLKLYQQNLVEILINKDKINYYYLDKLKEFDDFKKKYARILAFKRQLIELKNRLIKIRR